MTVVAGGTTGNNGPAITSHHSRAIPRTGQKKIVVPSTPARQGITLTQARGVSPCCEESGF